LVKASFLLAGTQEDPVTADVTGPGLVLIILDLKRPSFYRNWTGLNYFGPELVFIKLDWGHLEGTIEVDVAATM